VPAVALRLDRSRKKTDAVAERNMASAYRKPDYRQVRDTDPAFPVFIPASTTRCDLRNLCN
jgi:hypothetical protein